MPIKKMVVQITQKGAKKAAAEQKTLSSTIGKTARTVGKLAAAYITFRAAARGVTNAIDLARSHYKEQKKMLAVMKATNYAVGLSSAELNKYYSSLEGVVGISDELIKSAGTLLMTFKSIRGDAFKRTMQVAIDLAAIMGGDLRSSVLQLGKALEEPSIGLTALRRSGVSFTESEKAMIKSLIEANKLVEAQGIILKAVEGQVSGAAAAMMDEFDKVKVAWDNAFEEMGKSLLPLVTALMPKITKSLELMMEKLMTPEMKYKIKLGKMDLSQLYVEVGKLTKAYSNAFQEADYDAVKTINKYGYMVEAQIRETEENINRLAKKIADKTTIKGDLFVNYYDNSDLIPPTEEPIIPLHNLLPKPTQLQEYAAELKAIFVEAADSLKYSFTNSLVDSIMSGKLAFKSFVDYAIRELARLAIMKWITNPLAGLFGLSGGGSVTNTGGKIMRGAATGTDLIVPAGFPNDTYYQPVESGEYLHVESSANTSKMTDLMSQMVGILRAINYNLVSSGQGNNAPAVQTRIENIVNALDSERHDMQKRGYDGTGSIYAL